MNNLKAIAVVALLLSWSLALCRPLISGDVQISKWSDYELSLKSAGMERRCAVDEKLIDIKLSSDNQAVIISGTSYIPVTDVVACRSRTMLHAKRAGAQVGFLSDINLRAELYASMVPVAVNPMSFVAVVAKIGSDENIVTLPGFYRRGISKSSLLRDASSSMSPVISRDGRYMSLDLGTCGSGPPVDVVEIHRNRHVKLDRFACEKLFNYQ